ncbi:hypothetical protein GE107_19035 [Cohnella sp. CFH 77786]|uniref:hypothetical protein n=1 Tax=Cohnella sp. CFH 77786 TaxID=2662265 RepID=UPI001C60870D|nr:hypothetical protein [Cohnella sp. CFH 77786]MBW5448157.1 hypothetical protein [Cohnella sp. CFH 77786]
MSAFPPVSLTNIRVVTEEMLQVRLETVKTLAEDENEAYLIEKDAETGEHYLHYAVRHVNVAAGGAEEAYHHLMPLEHDDVIALALGAQEYAYPGFWRRPYLRNGPGGGYAWYDPDGAPEEPGRYEAIAAEIRAKLEAFRHERRGGEEEVARLMEQVDRLFEPDPTKSGAKSENQGPSPD